MRIFYSVTGDPMLLDTEQNLRSLQRALTAFQTSAACGTVWTAQTDGDPAPYDEFLQGLRIRKGEPSELHIARDRWLEFSGSPQDIEAFHLSLGVAGGEHRHLYCGPISLIVEADDSWAGMRVNRPLHPTAFGAG